MVDSRGEKLADEAKTLLVNRYVADKDGAIFVEAGFMDYFNRDGKRAEFCGNGARTYVAFVCGSEKRDEVEFDTLSGHLYGFVDSTFNVEMPTVKYLGPAISRGFRGELLRVGVPHFVVEGDTDDPDWELLVEARHELNANVNVYEELEPGFLRIRTFERGVERETGACGSGCTATAWCYRQNGGLKPEKVLLKANGGLLTGTFKDDRAFLGGGVERCSEELELLL